MRRELVIFAHRCQIPSKLFKLYISASTLAWSECAGIMETSRLPN